MMLELEWSGGNDGAGCEHGHLCAWIEQLSYDRRLAWTVDTPDEDDPEQTVNLAAGLAPDLTSAKHAVLEAMIRLGAARGGSWRAAEDETVIRMFPANRRTTPRKRMNPPSNSPSDPEQT